MNSHGKATACLHTVLSNVKYYICQPKQAGLKRPDGDFLFRQKMFYVAHGEIAVVKDTGGQHRVSLAFKQYLGHMFERASPTTGHDRHTYGFADASRNG